MKTILDHLFEHAERRPDAICVELFTKRKAGGRRTFGEIAGATERAAAFYAAKGIGTGDIVVLIGTHHLDFYAAWLGAVRLGAIPTVLAEPSVRIDRTIYLERLNELLARVAAKAVAVDPTIELANLGQVPIFSYSAIAEGSGSPAPLHRSALEDLALLQHSSGTTGLQKGVMLSHGALARHAESYGRAIEASSEDAIASWLPLYHDMGLIACFIMPLFYGMKVVWISPFEWVSSPALLLEAIAQHRATLTWLPNFAYPFLAQRTRGDFDLSSLRAVVNCSEPVTEEAMRALLDRFPTLDPNAVHTCYAMAENVFAVTTTRTGVPRRFATNDGRSWVSSGPCIEGCEVKIADGRILIRSPFLFDGYFRRGDLNADLFDAEGFFDTGDVGFTDEHGHAYVTGRKKDLIIIGGRNIYPQDVEQAVFEVDGVHPGRAVCFGVPMKQLGTEALIVLAESDAPEEEWSAIARRIKAAAASRLDLDVHDARIVAKKTLRKSTSGKLARGGNRDWYLEGKFGPLPRGLQS